MQNMEVTEALSYPAFIFFFSSFTWLDILIFYQYLGRARDSILREVNLKYEKDPSLLAEIISALPKKMESTLNQHKNRLLGSLPKTLDDFDPSSLIAKLEGGDKILVMDSNRDLPENWKDIDMKETFGVVEEASDDINPSNGGSDDCATDDASSSDEGATSDEATAPADVDEDDNEEYQDVAANSTINVENAKKPKRVLIFTTVVMLGLLAVCKNGSVDGTFKAMTRKWKQLFIYMVYYRGSFLPVAFGWLPNKHAISYHVFLLLLLLKFRENQVGIIDFWYYFLLNFCICLFQTILRWWHCYTIAASLPSSSGFTRMGGGYNNEDSGSLCPLFLGYYEDSHFRSPHYQSVVLTRQSSVLQTIRDNDGYDVGKRLRFSQGQYYSMCLLIFVNY